MASQTRTHRARRLLAALTAGLLLVGAGVATADAPAPGGLGGLGLDELLGRARRAADLLGQEGLGRLRVPGEVRVVVVSSAVDRETFGDGYASRLTLTAGADGVGLGTYAASVLFQVAPGAHVTSLDVYRDGRVNPAAVAQAVRWAREQAKEIDAVVLAFPPAAVLDP